MAKAFEFTVEFDSSELENQLMADFGPGSEVQRRWSEIVFNGSIKYMPMDTGNFINLSRIHSEPLFAQGELLYPDPYAQYLYQGHVMVNEKTGKGPALIPNVGYRYKKGTTLKATERPLTYDQSANPLAGPRWVERAKNDHYEEWCEELQKYINGGG